MSEKLVRQWLKKDDEDDEKKKERESAQKAKDHEDKKELFDTIDATLKVSFSKSLDDGCKALAQLHHSLFSSAVSGSDKAVLGLQYLKSKLGSFIDPVTDTGMFFILYSKHWFKLFLILESRASDFVTWMSYEDKDQLNFTKIISELNTSLQINYSFIEENHKFYTSVALELKGIISPEQPDSKDIGTNLHRLTQTSLRTYLTNTEDSKLKLQYISFFIGKQVRFTDINFNEILHEYGKAWFRKSLQFKQWFHKFIEALEKEPLLQRKMYSGFNWSKFKETPLKEVIRERKIIDESKD